MRRLAVMVVAFSIASCATGGGEQSTGGDGDPSPSTVASITAELEGLDPFARKARLAEIAATETETLTLYTSMNVDDSSVILDRFEDLYGIEVELYRASASAVLQRVLQEADAGFVGSDVVAVGSAEMTAIDERGLLHPISSPYLDEIVPSGVFDTWAAVYLNVFVAAWNLDLIADRPPETWEDVLVDYPGRLAMEVSDFDWFAALVEQYFVAELGYTEEEAIDLFAAAASGARMLEGHSLMVELTAAGEFDVVASAYQHGVERFRASGAPLAWEPAVEPLVVRPTGIGVHRSTDAPATALLFVDFMLSEAQSTLVELHRTPANQTIEGGIPPGYQTIVVGADIVGEDRGRWEGLYEQVSRQAAEPSP